MSAILSTFVVMKDYYKQLLEKEVITAMQALGSLGNLTLMIEGTKVKNGVIEKNDCEEMKVDVEWRDTLDKAYDIIAEFADKYGIER